MKILMINKFLYPNGGSETYMFKLGRTLTEHGHKVQYFGMAHEGNCVGNAVNSYTSEMDFHGGRGLSKIGYPIKTIYSVEARKKLRPVLEDFRPDVCHLNNFNYQLTPSVILEIRKWEKQSGHKVRIVYTAHDYQLICPNHLLYKPRTKKNCENCLGGRFFYCVRGRCIHESPAKSAIGALEAYFWKRKGVYRQIDRIICCSEFLKQKLDSNPIFADKTVAVHNFIEPTKWKEQAKEDYALYFGRFSEEKGVKTLISVCRELPEIQFVFAGKGPLEEEIKNVPNIRDVGFQSGTALKELIGKARFSICPSEWYENCPFSVMESQLYGTPVLASKIGGIPELIKENRTGEFFESGNRQEMKEKIQKLWAGKETTDFYSRNCRDINFDTSENYYEKIIAVYKQQKIQSV